MKKKELRILSLSIVVMCIAIAVVAYVIIRNSPAETRRWQISTQISGTGNQDTTEFTINNPWRIVWSFNNQTNSFFNVAVYVRNGTGFSPIADADASDMNAIQGILPVDYTGSFVIRVLTLADTKWSLRIDEFVKPS